MKIKYADGHTMEEPEGKTSKTTCLRHKREACQRIFPGRNKSYITTDFKEDINMSKSIENLKNEIVAWIREEFKRHGRDTAVIGISGGVDSMVTASLCTEALGKENVVGVMMPNGIQADFSDSLETVKLLGIKHYTVNIGAAYVDLLNKVKPGDQSLVISNQAKINLAPRLRMASLYAVAQSVPGRAAVVGTGNAAECYVGYFTKFGDGAYDLNPIRDLWKDEVIALGDLMGLPLHLTHKTPSDGLTGKSDEDQLGVKYAEIKKYALEGTSGNKECDQIIKRLHEVSEHKRNPAPYFKVN